MQLVRQLVLMCLQHNIMFKATHIPGVSNIVADGLSRLQVQRVLSTNPHLDREPTYIPEELLPARWIKL